MVGITIILASFVCLCSVSNFSTCHLGFTFTMVSITDTNQVSLHTHRMFKNPQLLFKIVITTITTISKLFLIMRENFQGKFNWWVNTHLEAWRPTSLCLFGLLLQCLCGVPITLCLTNCPPCIMVKIVRKQANQLNTRTQHYTRIASSVNPIFIFKIFYKKQNIADSCF